MKKPKLSKAKSTQALLNLEKKVDEYAKFQSKKKSLAKKLEGAR